MMRRIAAAVAFCLIAAGPALARERLHLPEALRSAIADLCPDCAARGVIACGGPDVRAGRGYLERARLGTPARAYLMRWPLGDQAIRHLSERLPLAAAEAAIAKAFADATLIALDADGTARALPPAQAEVSIPPALHACLADPAKPWGLLRAGIAPRGNAARIAWAAIESICAGSMRRAVKPLRFRWSRNDASMLTRKSAEGRGNPVFLPGLGAPAARLSDHCHTAGAIAALSQISSCTPKFLPYISGPDAPARALGPRWYSNDVRRPFGISGETRNPRGNDDAVP